jgi:hypothetical protein
MSEKNPRFFRESSIALLWHTFLYRCASGKVVNPRTGTAT